MNKYEETYNQTIEQIKKGKRTSPLKAIRLKCLDCMCWQANEVALCPSDDCVLWHYRFGKNKSGQRLGGQSLSNRFKSRDASDEKREIRLIKKKVESTNVIKTTYDTPNETPDK